MFKRSIRAACVSSFLLTVAAAAFSQAVANPTPSPDIIYTGKLLGYFRLPSQLSGAPSQRCDSPQLLP